MTRQMLMRLHTEDLIVDGFAGGGGASLGIEWALGRSPDIAINHDAEAIAMHAENHPSTRHYREDIREVDPAEATGGRRVALAWVVVRWAKVARPRVICVENVEEFEDWGPLLDDGRPCPERRGVTFRRWVAELEAAGYVVETRQLRACDYGAPTTRKRLFVIARCDGEPIAWPEPTHGPGRARPHRTAAECIEWAVPAPSIFERERPLAEKTLRRIARGVQRFVIEAKRPFIAPDGSAPTLIQTSWGERQGQAPRVPGLHKPLGVVMAGGVKHALVSAYLAKHYGGNEATGSALGEPIHTITAKDHHALVATPLHPAPLGRAAEVRAFLLKYYGTGGGAELGEPMHTVTARDRFALVTVAGAHYAIGDIGMRMLIPRELYRAQGFPDSYRIDFGIDGKPLSKTVQVKMCGNSVCPPLAAAIVRANCVAGAREVAA